MQTSRTEPKKKNTRIKVEPSPLARFGIVIQRHAHGTSMVSVVLPNDLLAVQLPEARVVIRARRHEVGRVGAKGAVPDPALVSRERRLEGQRLGPLAGLGRAVLDLPNLGRVVGAARGQLLDVGREQDAGNVLLVGGKVRHGHHAGAVVFLLNLPDEDVALARPSCQSRIQRKQNSAL